MEPPQGDSGGFSSSSSSSASCSERARLVGKGGSSSSTSSLRLKSLFPGPLDVAPGPPLENRRAEGPQAGLATESPRAPHGHLGPGSPGQSPQKLQARQKLSVACALCLLFMAGEVVGGYLAHSLAIMTDAAHLLTDVGSLSVSLFSLWLSTRPATKTMTFGWHRAEILGALASVLSIWTVTGVLVYLASARLISGDYEIDASAMLGTSACAVGVNIIMACLLRPSGSPHGHAGYKQMSESPCGGPLPPCPNTSVRAAFVHVVGDLLQSLGVFVAATVIYFKPQCKAADPISTFLFSVFVLGSTATILRDVFRVLMEGAPPRGVTFGAVQETLLSVTGVKETHDVHLWALTPSQPMVAAHLAVESSADMEAVAQEATALLRTKFAVVSCTIQVERYLEAVGTCCCCCCCCQCQDHQDWPRPLPPSQRDLRKTSSK